MARAISEIEREIRALEPDDQEHLELDGAPDPGVDHAWLDEAQNRSRELDTGVVQTIPAEEVFAKARADLKRQ